MATPISKNKIIAIRQFRQQGLSLPEIQKQVKVGYGTVYRYIQGVDILPRYRKIWFGKRGGSIKRKKLAEQYAQEQAKSLIKNVTRKEMLVFLCALYWGEGNKTDFSVINSDPNLIKVIVYGLQSIFNIDLSKIRLSLRLYDGIDKTEALQYWSSITQVPLENFGQIEVIQGKKIGKLQYGMCRVRVKKGGDLLKYVKAIYSLMASDICSRSSMDRAEVS